jgi:hypothetical protein
METHIQYQNNFYFKTLKKEVTMKTCKRNLIRTMALILPLLFLCSCYEFVFVNQQTDTHQNGIVKPVLCVQVYTIDDKPAVPYLGILVPKSWSVMNGINLIKEYNNSSIKMGKILFDKKLTIEMEAIDPAPWGYVWWVGKADTQISGNGVFKAYPILYTGIHMGDYSLDYMIGDSENG